MVSPGGKRGTIFGTFIFHLQILAPSPNGPLCSIDSGGHKARVKICSVTFSSSELSGPCCGTRWIALLTGELAVLLFLHLFFVYFPSRFSLGPTLTMCELVLDMQSLLPK
jgi:hypothetical protein